MVDIGEMYYWANYWHEQSQASASRTAALLAEKDVEIERLKGLAYHKGGTTYQSMFICTLDAMDDNQRLQQQVDVLRKKITEAREHLNQARYVSAGFALMEACWATDKIAKGE
jgi:hypothetical protein